MVWLTLKPNLSESAISLLMSVPFPTPDGPHTTSAIGLLPSPPCPAGTEPTASLDDDAPMVQVAVITVGKASELRVHKALAVWANLQRPAGGAGGLKGSRENKLRGARSGRPF